MRFVWVFGGLERLESDESVNRISIAMFTRR